MTEKIEEAFKDLISSLQIARLYSDAHPQFRKSVDKAYASLRGVLADRDELIIGIVGEEIAFEKEIFFELSKTIRPAILYLKEKGVEMIQFQKAVEVEELSKFIAFLAKPKEDIKPDPQESLRLLGIRNISAGKIKVGGAGFAGQEDKIRQASGYLGIFEDTLSKVTGAMESVLNGGPVDRISLRLTLNNVMDNLLGRYQEYLNFGTMKKYDSKTFFHTLNVSVLSMYFATRLGLSKEEVLDIGTSALFHDIGKIFISRKILQKPAKLTDEEFDKIKNHVTQGAKILLKYKDALGMLPVVICFEHHLKYNLSGYPKVAFYKKPHIASLLVSICDVYDALSQRRSYKSDYPPKMIYDIMMKEKGSTFEPLLLDKFFEIMGVWPVGTIVSLTDGRVGVVREENADDIFSPKVEVIAPADKKEIIDLREKGGKARIEKSLNPLSEGKEYLPLV